MSCSSLASSSVRDRSGATGARPVQVMEREFFSMVKNHWDVFLDVQATLWNQTLVESGAAAAIS